MEQEKKVFWVVWTLDIGACLGQLDQLEIDYLNPETLQFKLLCLNTD